MKQTQAKLEQAAKGLLMMSEADYPFTYFTSDTAIINDGLALKLAGKPEGTRIEATNIDYLFRNMTDAAKGSVSEETARQFKT